MKTEILKIEELKKTEYNPRKISKEELKKLENSIKEFGFVVPIVVNQHPDRFNIVISGHQRLDVAQKMDIKEVPCMIVKLDITKERALNLALNKISGEFEEDKLTEALLKIEEEDEDILSLTGFSNEEVNYLLGLREKEKEKIFAQSIEDDYEMGNKHGIEPGDMVILDDKHKIICGDSTDPDTFRKLFGEKKIDLVVTSPPYNIGKDYKSYNDNQDFGEYFKMIEKVFKSIKDFMNKGRYLCLNIGKESGPINIAAEYNNIMIRNKYQFFRNIYWLKPFGSGKATHTYRNPFPRMYSPVLHTEIIEIYAFNEEPKNLGHVITYKIGESKKIKKERIPDVLLSKYIGNVWEFNTEGQLSGEHPAPFPTQLPFNCIRFFSFEDEIILDPFLGSGTTILAADQLNRKGYGIEIDPDYVSLAIDRYLLMKPTAKFKIIKG